MFTKAFALDLREACSGTGFLSYRQPPPLNKNILESLRRLP